MSEYDKLVKRLRDPALVATRVECADAIKALQAEVERLKGVLEFYAKEENWADHFDRNTGASYTPASRDGGAIARKAIEAKP